MNKKPAFPEGRRVYMFDRITPDFFMVAMQGGES
jgi:hypothetical protein